MEKKKEIELAKKRRAKLLAEYERTRHPYSRYATKYGVSTSRIGFMLRVARKENE